MEIIKFIAFICSLVGYTAFIRLNTNCSKHLVYIGVISFQVMLLYIAAFLSILEMTAWFLYLLGFVLLASICLNHSRRILPDLVRNINAVSILMVLYVFIYVLSLWNQRLIHYDNFTHWATIVKFFYLENRLPTATDTIITYNNYPVGSSLYLYYMAKFVGFKDGILMIGQFMVIAAAQFSVFEVVKDKRRMLPNAIIFATFGITTYLAISIRYNNLLVDALIAMLTVAAISALYRMENNLTEGIVSLALILNLLVMVKASALFFVIGIILAYCVVVWKKIFRNRSLRYLALSLVPLLALANAWLWSTHVQQTFGDLVIKKHEVHAGSLVDILHGHLTNDQTGILQAYLGAVFSFKTASSLQITVIFVLGLTLLIFYGIKYHQWKSNCIVFLSIASVTAFYYVGNLIMYLTAMPVDEALRVAGFERYILTIILIDLFVFVMQIVRRMDDAFYEKNYLKRNHKSFKSFQNKKLYELSTMVCLIVFAGFIISDTNGMTHQMKTLAEEQIVFENIAKNKHFDHGRYLVVSAQQEQIDNYFLMYYARYLLWTPNVDARYDFIVSPDEFTAILNHYDGVLLLDDHYTFKANVKLVTGLEIETGYYEVKGFKDHYLSDNSSSSVKNFV